MFPLYLVSEKNFPEVVSVLLSVQDIDVNKQRRQGFTALFITSEKGHSEVVRLLLQWVSPKDPTVRADVNLATEKNATPLYIACEKGQTEVVRLLLGHADIDVNRCFDRDFAPFFVACECGHVDIVKLVLKDGRADFNKPQYQGATPFFMACQQGHVEVVRLLRDNPQIDLNRCRDTGATPLYIACEFDHPEVVKELLQSPKLDLNKQRNGGFTPLFRSCEKGRLAIVKLLLADERINVNLASDKGATPLYVACQEGRAEVVRELLAHPSVDKNKCFDTTFTPFFVACESGHLAIVELMLQDPDIDVNKPQYQGATPFFMACQKGHLKVVKCLLQSSRIDFNMPRDTGATPLYIACEFNHPEIVRELLVCDRIDPNRQRNGGFSPFFRVCEKGHLEILKVMMASPHVDINLGSEKGATPLYIACEKNQIEVVRELLKHPEIDVNKPFDKGFAPLFVACEFGHTDVVKLLISDPRADLNKPQYQGATPFFMACQQGQVETVKVLVTNENVDINRGMEKGETPLWIAAQNGFDKAIKWILVSARPVNTKARWAGNSKTAAEQARSKNHEKIATLIEAYERNPEQLVSELEVELGILENLKTKREIESLRVQLSQEKDRVKKLLREIQLLKQENDRIKAQAPGPHRPKDDHSEEMASGGNTDLQTAAFRSEELAKITNDFSLEFKIGEGGQAEVFKGVLAGVPIVIKKYNTSSPAALQSLHTELEIARRFRHPHILPLLGHTHLKDPNPCLIFPYMTLGTLRERLEVKEGREPLNWETRLRIAIQAAEGLAHLHGSKDDAGLAGSVLHMDVKSANILLSDDFHVRIADFGLSRTLDDFNVARTQSAFGTIGYLCPDFLVNGTISTKTDVFAFGVVLAELITGKQAIFHDANGRPLNLSRFVLTNIPLVSALIPYTLIDPEIKKEGTQAAFRVFGQILRSCLDPDPEKRPEMRDVLRKLEDLQASNYRVCLVCMDNPSNGKMNCGHAVLCFPCAEYLLKKEGKCPLCRVTVTGVEQGCYDRSFVV